MENYSHHPVQVGLIGAGIQASRSPHLHECEARAAGIALRYYLFDLELLEADAGNLLDLLAQAQTRGFAGVNITHPCKQAVIPLLDELSPEAAAIGAVNTVVFRAGRRIGYNTDCFGFAENFRRGLAGVSLRRVVLLGAGGAGSAVAVAALELGAAELTIYDADHARALALTSRLQTAYGSERVRATIDLAQAMAEADGLIQATPVGMLGHPGLPLPLELLRPAQWVAEIIYFPLETELLRQARQIGCRTLDGGGMAVFQAAAAFRLFTDVTPDGERMLRCFARMTEEHRHC
ncbi:MAG: shikimate dehydrogenase [Blastocatellia bacterium]